MPDWMCCLHVFFCLTFQIFLNRSCYCYLDSYIIRLHIIFFTCFKKPLVMHRVEAAVPDRSDGSAAPLDVRMFREAEQVLDERRRPVEKGLANSSKLTQVGHGRGQVVSVGAFRFTEAESLDNSWDNDPSLSGKIIKIVRLLSIKWSTEQLISYKFSQR